MWYKNSYRRHLLDMHIDDWNDEFLSEFSVDDYFTNLRTAGINNAMVYLQSHAGHCHYPTKSGHMHRCFESKPHETKKLIDKLHENGIYVTGYYSLIYNTYAHDVHPEWRMVWPEGNSTRAGNGKDLNQNDFASTSQRRYGLCCPNNPAYREFLKEQMREIAEYVKVDAMFFDMLFWPHFCYCEHCRARWEKEVGGDIPTVNGPDNPMWLKQRQVRREWMGEFAKFVTDYQKELVPGIPVEHNVATMMEESGNSCCSVFVNDSCDYAGGDLYGDIYSQSFTCKFYKNASKNQPFEYMFSRCQPSLRNHTMTKSYDVMLSSVMTTAAHHGATLVIDAIDPVGTMDARVYERIGRIFDFQKKYEPYFRGKMVEDVGIYYSMRSKFTPHGDRQHSHSGAVNATKTMIYKNIPVGVTGEFYTTDSFKCIVAPCLTSEDAFDNERLINYVKDGGNLYLSTSWNKSLLKSLFNAEILEDTQENVVYLSPSDDTMGTLSEYTKKYPLNFDGHASVIKLDDSECRVLATLTLPYTKPTDIKFASIHSNPPGVWTDIPALVYKKVGKGSVMWSAVPIECSTDELCREAFAEIISVLCKEEKFSFISNAPYNCEITMFEDGSDLYVNAVNLNENIRHQTIAPFSIKVYTGREPSELVVLPEGKKVEFEFDNGYTQFRTDELHFFEMYRIKLD